MKRQGIVLSTLVVLLSLALPGAASADYVHVGTFSGPGTEPGQLETPGRAAVEQSTGNLFVVDSGNDRIQVFAPNETGTPDYLTSFGTGELSEPWGIAIAEAGGTSVYVADAGNGRIVKYDSDGAEAPTFTIDATFTSPAAGSGSGEVGSFKAALAIDPTTGDLLLADNTNKLIQRFEADGTFISAFDGSNGATAFSGPIDVAVNSSGDVYVVDANGDIANAQGTSEALRYSGAGEYKAELAPVGERERAATVAVNPDNDEVVVSGNQDNVYELGPPPFVPIVQRFDAANQPLPSPALDSAATYDTVSGLAIAGGGKDRIYVVLDRGSWNGAPFGSPQIQAFDEIATPAVVLDPVEPGTITADRAIVEGSVNPHGLPTEWRLEYRRTGAESWSRTEAADAGSGTEPVPVSAQLTGLFPNTEYEVRLVAVNSDGEVTSPAQAFTTVPGPPFASVTFASGVGTASAWLNGGVNPFGEPTTYRFEYGTQSCEANTCLAVPVGSPSNAGAGMAAKQVAVKLDDLQAATTYHFRVIAENALGSHVSEEQTFTTLAAGDSPYGWELVSPPQKGGGEVAFDGGFFGGGGALSPDGSRVAYVSRSTLVDDTGAPMASTYVATRGAQAWASQNVTPPLASSEITNRPLQAPVRPLSEDLTKGVVQTNVDPVTHQRTGRMNLYFRDFATDEYRLLTPDALGGSPQYAIDTITYVVFDWTPSLSHIVFVSTAELTSDSIGVAGRKAYVIPTATGKPVLASVLSDSSAGPAGDLLSVSHHNENVLSDDGSKLFFETDAGLHLRDLETEETLDLPGRFADASVDGRYVMVHSAAQLTAGDTDGEEDLYRVDTEDPGAEPILISVDEEPADGQGGALVANLALTPDGAKAYFAMAGSQLVKGAPLGGEDEIYFWDEEEGLSFVGSFQALAEPMVNYTARSATVDINSSGNTLVVHSRSDMTPPQEAGRLPGATFKEQQIYVYERQRSTPVDPSLACVSCLPGPGPTNFRTRLSSDKGEGMFRNSARKFVSTDGTVIFQTMAPLIPTDTNGGNFDVYRYRNGNLELVSPGRQPFDAYLFGASPTGTIAFATVERLTPWDVDNSTDAYISRPGAGFAEPPPKPAPCVGDCQGPAPAPPPSSAPASSAVAGPGNPKRVRPKARCKRRSKAGKGRLSAPAAKKSRCRSTKTKKATKRGEK